MSSPLRAAWLGLALLGIAAPTRPMKTFVILFRQSPRELTPADLAARQREVSAWAARVNADGHQLEPRILEPATVRPAPGPSGAGEGAWPLTALLFLHAADLDEAARVAASHPAVQFGASVEVRAWQAPAPQRARQP